MIPAHPLPPEPVTSVPMDAWQPPDLLSALTDLPMSFWRWFDTVTGLPHWFLPLAVGCYLFAAFAAWVTRLLGPDDEWWTTDPKDTSRVLVSDLRKDSEAADGPRSDREAKCPSGPDAPAVRRCRECAAPIDPVDPVDDLLDGLFEDAAEPGLTGWKPGLTGWKPGMPDWGTPPLLPLRNQAQADLFRQMMSDALRRQEGGRS